MRGARCLTAIGEDAGQESLQRTPELVADMYDARMVTSTVLRDFKTNQSTRDEFLVHLERGDSLMQGTCSSQKEQALRRVSLAAVLSVRKEPGGDQRVHGGERRKPVEVHVFVRLMDVSPYGPKMEAGDAFFSKDVGIGDALAVGI